MATDANTLIAAFAEAVRLGEASVFVGAGLSVAAGLDDWKSLIKDIREVAQVPDAVSDGPLAAEYVVQERGRNELDEHVRNRLDTDATPTASHFHLAALAVRDFWTTNYDTLMEDALSATKLPLRVLVSESDYQRGLRTTAARRLTKMHGSLEGEPRSRTWSSKPVLTRTDYEWYEERHPITWARLRAEWLTNSFLFLGLSFDDPNLNILLQLTRSLPENAKAPTHYVVLKREAGELDARLQDLRVRDLEASGVTVIMIDSFDAMTPLLARLEVRCREPRLFIAGSFDAADREASEFAASVASGVGQTLAQLVRDHELAVASFGGPSALAVGRALRDALGPSDYSPESIRFYYRKAVTDDESLPIEHRVGMAVFTEQDLAEMRTSVFQQVRAMLIVGGGRRTAEEAREARAHGVQIIPVAATGGAAEQLWQEILDQDGIEAHDLELWNQLRVGDAESVTKSAVEMVGRLMFA
ncbi:SIR2 family protein [Microcella daejeonensis]|uniref:SIR2 family protein n=1 Tax=Microcella daejeonensis TaxID=2994971 RepID=A0A9E8SAM7_9MICO|nr:SIR2 family protein [Microcella daejeonensis]WAB80797.1 SIR2 family protein [Microcella daejeonensis]